MKNKLKEQALSQYFNIIEFLRYVLKDFPDDKINQKIEESETPLQILRHLGGTANFWMGHSDRLFSFKAEINDIDSFFDILELQLKTFKTLLEDENELYWKSSTMDKPRLSIPWIMIRTANHMQHHAGMLIFFRHIYALPVLEQSKQLNWSVMVDFPGDLHYSELE